MVKRYTRRILAIPGPTIVSKWVYDWITIDGLGHMSPEFTEVFRQVLVMLRDLVYMEDGQPIVLTGSGTLGMEASITSMLKKGDRVLVISNGYFGESVYDLLSRYPVERDIIRASEPGVAVDNEVISGMLDEGDYDIVIVTHVDTSTGVKHDVKELANIVRRRGKLLIVDGVCSVGGIEVRMDEWGIDVIFTGSQKALGCPVGLSIIWLSDRALDRLEETRATLAPYYMDLTRWRDVMVSYEEGSPKYYATPAVNLIHGLYRALETIFDEGLEERFKRHSVMAEALRDALRNIGLRIVAHDGYEAETVTGVYLPQGIHLKSFLREAYRRGVTLAGGLLKDIKDKYFRIGHMGEMMPYEIISIISVIEMSLKSLGYSIDFGSGVCRAQEIFIKHGY